MWWIAGLAVRGRRALVEDPERAVAPRARAGGGRRRPRARTRGSARSSSGKLTFGSTGSNRVISYLLRPHTQNASSLGAGTRRGPRGTTPLAGASRPRPLTAAVTASRVTGGPGCVYCGRVARVRFGQRLGEDVREGPRRRAHTVPGSLGLRDPSLLVPVIACSRDATRRGWAMVTVRVIPRSGRTAVRPGPTGVVVRVRAAPEDGHGPPRRRDARSPVALGVPGPRSGCVRARARGPRCSRWRAWRQRSPRCASHATLTCGRLRLPMRRICYLPPTMAGRPS